MTRETEREPWAPAFVRGNERAAVAVFIEDAAGDLVDIEYHCEDYLDERPEWWPAFDFGDQDIYCQDCGALINVAPR